MKPWEETWTDQRFVIELGDTGRRIGTFDDDLALGIEEADPNRDRARARLAAQAPAMARLLLDLAHHSDDDCCLRCDHGRGMPHADDCSIGVVLRAAGVIE